MFKSLVLAAVLAVPTLANADLLGFAFLETYTIPVNPIDATTFETIEADGAGGTQHWCAAAIFARRVMGVDQGNLYVKEARGPSRTVPGRIGVVFTTQEVPGASKSYSQGVRDAGKTFSVGHANALCHGTNFADVRIVLPNGQFVRR